MCTRIHRPIFPLDTEIFRLPRLKGHVPHSRKNINSIISVKEYIILTSPGYILIGIHCGV